MNKLMTFPEFKHANIYGFISDKIVNSGEIVEDIHWKDSLHNFL